MRFLLRGMLAALLALCLLLAGCDAVFVGFVSNPGGRLSVSGTVSFVQSGFIQDVTGNRITVTAVTFLGSGTATTITFCGDRSGSFPMNQFVRADFTSGIYCATLIAVTVITE